MAILTLRSQGKGSLVDRQLVRVIGRIDSLGEAEARRELGTELMSLTNTARKMIVEIIKQSDPYFCWETTAKKVKAIARVLAQEMDDDAMIHTIKHLAEKESRVPVHFTERLGGRLGYSVVEGEYRIARTMGQKLYPFTLVYAPRFPSQRKEGMLFVPRFTIVKQPDMVWDMNKLKSMLSENEASVRTPQVDMLSQDIAWGGPLNIACSPEMDPTKQTEEMVLAIVERFITTERFKK